MSNPYASPQDPYESPYVPAPGDEGEPLERVTVWPSVVGIFSIVLGVGGVLMGIYGAIVGLVMSQMGGITQSQLGYMFRFRTELLSFGMLGALIAAGLLALGIGLLRRRGRARRAALTWSIIKMLFVLGQSLFNWRMQQLQFDALMADQTATPGFDADTFTLAVTAVSFIFSIVWGWALPIFLIIWMNRSAVRAETATWSHQTLGWIYRKPQSV